MTRNKHDGSLQDPDPSDASWEAFAREHKEELSDIAGSKDARRFERHARKAKEKHDEKGKFSYTDFKNSAFVSGGQPGPRSFRTSWLDADSLDNRFTAPETVDSFSVQAAGGIFTGVACILLGIIAVLCAVRFPQLSQLLAICAAVLFLVALGIFASIIRSSRKTRHTNGPDSSSPPFADGAQI